MMTKIMTFWVLSSGENYTLTRDFSNLQRYKNERYQTLDILSVVFTKYNTITQRQWKKIF
jgi:hypothetical protein